MSSVFNKLMMEDLLALTEKDEAPFAKVAKKCRIHHLRKAPRTPHSAADLEARFEVDKEDIVPFHDRLRIAGFRNAPMKTESHGKGDEVVTKTRKAFFLRKIEIAFAKSEKDASRPEALVDSASPGCESVRSLTPSPLRRSTTTIAAAAAAGITTSLPPIQTLYGPAAVDQIFDDRSEAATLTCSPPSHLKTLTPYAATYTDSCPTPSPLLRPPLSLRHPKTSSGGDSTPTRKRVLLSSSTFSTSTSKKVAIGERAPLLFLTKVELEEELQESGDGLMLMSQVKGRDIASPRRPKSTNNCKRRAGIEFDLVQAFKKRIVDALSGMKVLQVPGVDEPSTLPRNSAALDPLDAPNSPRVLAVPRQRKTRQIVQSPGNVVACKSFASEGCASGGFASRSTKAFCNNFFPTSSAAVAMEYEYSDSDSEIELYLAVGRKLLGSIESPGCCG
ncbi:hypothetical protein HDU97_008148 [Phlyctochytrium planicorne]|nr:hypothetical protein HDU97_008148 [Phlyctochytrium planicorne]